MGANTLVTPTKVMRQIGVRLVNNLKFGANNDRSYSDEFKDSGGKVGYTVNARLPQRYKVNKGQNLVITDVGDNIVPITLTDQANVGLEFSMASLTQEVDDYRRRYVEPAVDALINQVDYDGLNRMYQATYFTVGTPAVVPGSTGTLPMAANIVYQGAVTKLAEIGVNTSSLVAMLTPNMHAYLTAANAALFNPQADIAKQYKTGQFGTMALGVSKWFMDQNCATHVVGALGGTPVVNGASQTGASIVADGATASITSWGKKGDVIQFASVYAVNTQNYQSTGRLMDFVLTADVDSDGSGNITLPIAPAIVTTGVNQNVTNSPADGEAITIFSHASSYAAKVTPQGLIYAPGAYALVFADLEKPGGLWVAERISNKALGIAVRFLKDYSIMTDQSPARVDVLYGWKDVRPEMACRVCS